MFTFFHLRKLQYEKGQVLPFFIMFVALLVIMAMVSVNLGKVAFIKTDASNGADAGAIAAGSMMANYFNSAAKANEEMQVAWQEFYISLAIETGIALAAAIAAYAIVSQTVITSAASKSVAPNSPITAYVIGVKDCALTGKALVLLETLATTIWGMIIAVTAFHVAQLYYYKSIRKMLREGREVSIKTGHQFVFLNSGIGSKLTEEQRDTLDSFMDGLEHEASYTFDWRDGQDRDHAVTSRISIGEVDDFELKVCVLPLAAELGVLGAALVIAYMAKTFVSESLKAYCIQKLPYAPDQVCKECCEKGGWAAIVCCPCHVVLLALGIAGDVLGNISDMYTISGMTPVFYLLPTALAGAAPAYTVDDSWASNGFTFIICWIDDVDHDRLARAEAWQSHGGADLGLWQTGYPNRASQGGTIYSYGVSKFDGGSIGDFEFTFDAQLVETDNRPGEYDPCPFAVARVRQLEQQIQELGEAGGDYLSNRAEGLGEQADHLSQAVGGSNVTTVPDSVNSTSGSKTGLITDLNEGSDDLNTTVQYNSETAEAKQEKIDNIKSAYPHCAYN